MRVSAKASSVTSFFLPAEEAFHASYKDLPDGSFNERLVSTSIGASEATALPSKLGPEVEESTLMYATAFLRSSSANCSPHSVDPVSPTSSPSQLHMTRVRRGRVPCFSICPSARVISIIEAVPLLGSTPP